MNGRERVAGKSKGSEPPFKNTNSQRDGIIVAPSPFSSRYEARAGAAAVRWMVVCTRWRVSLSRTIPLLAIYTVIVPRSDRLLVVRLLLLLLLLSVSCES